MGSLGDDWWDSRCCAAEARGGWPPEGGGETPCREKGKESGFWLRTLCFGEVGRVGRVDFVERPALGFLMSHSLGVHQGIPTPCFVPGLIVPAVPEM